MKKFIYADNAATTKLDPQAFDVMREFLLFDYSNASQPYSFSKNSKKALKKAREIIAECINANPEEIIFTSGGSEGNNWVIKSNATLNRGCDFVASNIEHHSVLNAYESTKYNDCTVSFAEVNEEGILTQEALASKITDSVKLVSVMLANNEIGTIEPVRELCSQAHKNNILFHTDAVQAVGHIPIDVRSLGVDFLSASAHKFNGPKGVGFLYVKDGITLPSLIDGGSQEFGRRAGTENIAGVAAMAVALKNNIDKMNENSAKLYDLENMFVSVLKNENIDFVRNGYEKHHLPGNVSISIKDADGEMLLHRLDLMGICVSTGSACNAGKDEISHVIKAIKVPSAYAKGTIRISLGSQNESDDAITIAKSISKIINS